MTNFNMKSILLLVFPLMALSVAFNQLIAQPHPPVEQYLEDPEAFFPKRKSLNKAIERSREDQKRLQENAYPNV